MNSKTTVIFLSLLLITGAMSDAHARIYKTVDKEGNVVFTDIPPKDESQAIEIDTRNNYTPEPLPATAPVAAGEVQAEDAEPGVSYDSLSIVTPTNDEPVRENAGNINIAVAANPSVDTDSGHSLEILMDGVVQASGGRTNVSLTNVDRGTHTVTARIVDAEGNVLISADPITFHMLRASVLNRPKPRAG